MKREITIKWVDEAASTNTTLAFMTDVPDAMILAAHTQTAGRGQRGNSWEAEPGKNLTFSMLLRPQALRAANQFVISQIVALSIADAIDTTLPTTGAGEIKIKWPNDIYHGDRKICGILIENILSGMDISQTIAGIGLNVNQETFHSDAPNPVSMKQISGRDHDLQQILTLIGENIVSRLDAYENTPGETAAALAGEYFGRLWRADGCLHPFIDRRDPDAPEHIQARIVDIAPTGHLTLVDADGTERTFAFKEVAHILGQTAL